MKSPGEYLKQAREAKKISLKKVSEDTKFNTRHVEALEEDNYSVFPGETYTLGFLRSYANYLEVDPEQVIQMYRGSLIEEREPPLQELTQPTSVGMGDYIEKYSRPAMIVLAVVAILAVVGISFWNSNQGSGEKNVGEQSNESLETFLENSATIPSVKTEHVKLNNGFTTAVFSQKSGIDFSIENTEIFIVLEQLSYSQDGHSSATFEFFPGRQSFTLTEGGAQVFENGIPRKVRISFISATPNNVKIQVDQEGAAPQVVSSQGEEKVQERIANPSNFIIRVEATVTEDNYVEFFIDGKPGKKGRLARGSTIFYEANDSIQMKIGNAGGIILYINGEKQALGRRGELVHKIIRKERDPVEQTKFKIVMKDA